MALLFLCALLAPARAANAPANDDFDQAVILTETNLVVSGSNTNASKEGREPDHAGNRGGASVWWAWTAPANGELTLTTDDSDADTILAVYVGDTLSNLSLAAANDDHGVRVTSRVRFAATAGVVYRIAVDGYNDGTGASVGNIRLGLMFLSEPILRPANDAFANRLALTGASVSLQASNARATGEPGEPVHADESGDASLWWEWTAPAAGRVTLSTVGSDFDTLLAVYTNDLSLAAEPSLPSLVPVVSNDDIDSTNGVLTSRVIFDASQGQAFQIAVDGFDAAQGQITLALDLQSIEPVKPSLGSPAILSDGSAAFTVIGAPAQRYTIRACADWTNWVAVGEVMITNGAAVFVDAAATNHSRRFYRATQP